MLAENDILVVGFPKSGNTYLSRLLGDILDCPVTGWGTAHPIAEEGLDRIGRYCVRQLHLHPVDHPMTPNFSAWEYSVPSANGECIVIVRRNPLDVIVSVYHYWQMDSMDKAIEAVLFGKRPLNENIGTWGNFYSGWEKAMRENYGRLHYSEIFYEDLLGNDSYYAIDYLLDVLNIEHDKSRIIPAIERQSFDNRKKELEHSGDKYNYGATIQTRNLRHGRAGDWRTELTAQQVDFIKQFLPKGIIKLYDL